MASPAEQSAAREGWPVVLLIPFEAMRIAAGHPMRVRTVDGADVLVRLATADEFWTRHLNARAELQAQGLPVPAAMGRAEAERLTAPIGSTP